MSKALPKKDIMAYVDLRQNEGDRDETNPRNSGDCHRVRKLSQMEGTPREIGTVYYSEGNGNS